MTLPVALWLPINTVNQLYNNMEWEQWAALWASACYRDF